MNTQTLLSNALVAARLRSKTLDSIWTLALLAIFCVVFAVWFLQTLNFDLTGFAWTIAAIAAMQHATAIGGARATGSRSVLLAITATQLAGIVGIAVLWHLSGAWHNPMLLLFFAVPIIGAGITQQRWQLGITLTAIVLTVIAVSLANSQLLRWYLEQRGIPNAVLECWQYLLPPATQPYPEIVLPIGYLCVALTVFIVAALTIGLVTAELSAVTNGRLSHAQLADEQLRYAQKLAENLVKKAPLPTVLMVTNSGQIVSASDGLLRLYPELQTGARLASSVSFSHPEIVEQHLLGADGNSLQRVGQAGDARFAQVHIRHLSGSTIPLALLTWVPCEHHELTAALNLLAEPMLLINSLQRIEWLNRAAQQLFEQATLGSKADAALEDGMLPVGWWNPGRRSSSIFEITVKQLNYRVSCVSGKADGVADPFVLLRFTLAPEQASSS